MKSSDSQIYNLAFVVEIIESYLNSKKMVKKLNEDEINFLNQIVKKINAIEHILKGWLSVGQISDYHLIIENNLKLKEETFGEEKEKEKEKEKKSDTQIFQKKLLKESKKMHTDMLIFTYMQTKDIIKLFEDFRKLQGNFEDKSHSDVWQFKSTDFHHDIDKCLNAVVNSIEKDGHIEEKISKSSISDKNIEKELNESHHYEAHLNKGSIMLLTGKLPIQKRATKFGAIYYPFTQFLNPLAGGEQLQSNASTLKNEGMCGGLVMVWGDEIIKKGKFLHQPVGDRNATSMQKNQFTYFKKWMNESKSGKNKDAVIDFDYKDISSLRDVLSDLFNHIDSKSVYMIKTYINDNDVDSHILGIRRLENGNVEFYDPNYGIFVFPSMTHFECWFPLLYEQYSAKHGGTITLSNMGRQSENAVATLPVFETLSEYQAVTTLIHDVLNRIEKNDGNKNKWIALFSLVYHVFQTVSNFIANHPYDSSLVEHVEKMYKQVEANISTVFFAQSLKLSDDEDSFDQSEIKPAILSMIAKHIKKSKTTLYGKDVCVALEELKDRIKNAKEGVTINALISHWLTDQFGDNNQTYGNILKEYADATKDKKIYKRISRLSDDYEINPFKLKLLQLSLLITIDRVCYQLKQNFISDLINKIFTDSQFSTPNEKLREIKKIKLERKSSHTFFDTNEISNINQIKELLAILNKIDPISPASLISVNSQLNRFCNDIKVKEPVKDKKNSISL